MEHQALILKCRISLLLLWKDVQDVLLSNDDTLQKNIYSISFLFLKKKKTKNTSLQMYIHMHRKLQAYTTNSYQGNLRR